MKVIDIKLIEDCLDGSYIKEILLDSKVTKEFIFYLKDIGKLNYYESFAWPFFKIVDMNKFIIKGVEGNTTTSKCNFFKPILSPSV